jgi:hypothetical protein
MAAYEAWQNDLQNTELADDYFEKLTDLDRNLEQRGLEKVKQLTRRSPCSHSINRSSSHSATMGGNADLASLAWNRLSSRGG